MSDATYEGPDRRGSDDVGKLASAADVIRRWWALAVGLMLIATFTAGVWVGYGAAGANMAALTDRVERVDTRVRALESLSSQVSRVEGMVEGLYRSQTGRSPKTDFPPEVTP